MHTPLEDTFLISEEMTDSRVAQFSLPSNAMFSGCSGAGKTRLVLAILSCASWIIHPPPVELYWFYGVPQDYVFEELKKLNDKAIFRRIVIQQGLPNFSEHDIDRRCPKVIVLDDLISSTASSDQKILEEIFFYFTHHYNCLTFLLTQNLFHSNRVFRGISLNTHYFILFPNKRDKLQCRVLFRQVEPKNHFFLEEVYSILSDESCYSYIFLDLHPKSDPILKVRSDILNPVGATVWLQKAPPSSTLFPVTVSELMKEVEVDGQQSSSMSESVNQISEVEKKEDNSTVVLTDTFTDDNKSGESSTVTEDSVAQSSIDSSNANTQHQSESSQQQELSESSPFYTMLTSGRVERTSVSQLKPQYLTLTIAILRKLLYMLHTESKKRLKDYFLNQASLETIIAVNECFLNISKKFVPLSKRELSVLTASRRAIRKLVPGASPERLTKGKVEEIRKIISNNTHILKYVIQPVLSYLSEAEDQ